MRCFVYIHLVQATSISPALWAHCFYEGRYFTLYHRFQQNYFRDIHVVAIYIHNFHIFYFLFS